MVMASDNGGRAANRAGRTAEQVIAAVLQSRGVSCLRQHPLCLGIYGTTVRADFYVPALPDFPNGLAIESKWQDVNGSADEKLPYLVANISECYPCPTIIVIDGGGFREGAIVWVRTKIDRRSLYAVHTLAEFVSWTNRKLSR
jgi:hypothetical protein